MNGSLPLETKLSFTAVNAAIKTKYCFRMKNWLYLMKFIWHLPWSWKMLHTSFTNKSKWWLMHLLIVLVVYCILNCLNTASSNPAAELIIVEEQWVLDVSLLGKKFWGSLQSRGNVCLLLLVLFSTVLSQQYFISARDPESPVQRHETSLFLGFWWHSHLDEEPLPVAALWNSP